MITPDFVEVDGQDFAARQEAHNDWAPKYASFCEQVTWSYSELVV